MKLSNTETEIEDIVQTLQSKGWSFTTIQFALLSIGNIPLDMLPSADKEREEIITKSKGESFVVFTPQLIRRLLDQLSTRIGTIPALPDTSEETKEQIRKHLYTWSESIQSVLAHWGIAKFMLQKGEYKSTQALINDLLEAVHKQGYQDIEALMYLDLGEVNALYGNRKEANQCFLTAVQLFQEKVQGQTNKFSGMFKPLQLAEIPERAYFGIGMLVCDFFWLKEAEEAFGNMNTDEPITKALVHFCREEFQESIQLLSKIQPISKYPTRFHYYLYYYLRLLDADMFWVFRNYDNAIKLYTEVLDVSTKLGWPRHQVHALNGFAKTYSAPGNQHDMFKAAKYAVQAIGVANMSEYRVGRAFAGYYMGQIYTSVGLKDVSKGAYEYSLKKFLTMEHEFGINRCREGLRWIIGRYETFATEPNIPSRIWNDYESNFRVGNLTRVPIGFKNSPCLKCGKPALSGAIICTPDGTPVIESADDDDPNILCLSCGYWFD